MIRVVAVVIATLAYGVALWMRDATNVWVVTGAAAVLALMVAIAADAPGLRSSVRPTGRAVAWGIGLGVAMAAATWAVYPLALAVMPSLQGQVVDLYAELRAPPGPSAAMPVLTLVVLGEEVIWRGVLVDHLEARGRARWAVIAVAALAYPIPHLASASWLLPVIALGCGVIWTVERVLTRSLLASTLTHWVWDVLVFVWLPLE